jgi:hypothetical protein
VPYEGQNEDRRNSCSEDTFYVKKEDNREVFRCHAMPTGENVPTFRRNVIP